MHKNNKKLQKKNNIKNCSLKSSNTFVLCTAKNLYNDPTFFTNPT